MPRTSQGRGDSSTQLAVRFSADERRALDARAAKDKTTASGVVRQALVAAGVFGAAGEGPRVVYDE
jgi:hypothetical protein